MVNENFMQYVLCYFPGKQSSFIYLLCGPFTKNQMRIFKFNFKHILYSKGPLNIWIHSTDATVYTLCWNINVLYFNIQYYLLPINTNHNSVYLIEWINPFYTCVWYYIINTFWLSERAIRDHSTFNLLNNPYFSIKFRLKS